MLTKIYNFIAKTSSSWLKPAIVIIILFIFINFFLANEDVIPYEYNIFSKCL